MTIPVNPPSSFACGICHQVIPLNGWTLAEVEEAAVLHVRSHGPEIRGDPKAAVREYMKRARAQGQAAMREAFKREEYTHVTMDEASLGPVVEPFRAQDVFRTTQEVVIDGKTLPAGTVVGRARPPLDAHILSLPEDSGERHAWEELRRLRNRVILYLSRIAEAPTLDTSIDAVLAGGEELADWMRHAEREWPKVAGQGDRAARGGTVENPARDE